MLYRLRTDFQLTIITLFAACATLGLVPFVVYRLVNEQFVVGAIDASIVASILAATLYAWRTGDTRRPGFFLALTNTTGTVLVASILGTSGLFWMYTTLMSNFFLVPPRVAAMITATALLVLALGGKFESTTYMASFLITASLVSVFAYIFAARSESQRAQLKRLAMLDPLTGIGNRRAMEHELHIAVETFKRKQLEFGLIMLDLDHFKHVNDRFGHDAGDRVLVAFTELIGKSTRNTDRLFRFGGEEFVLLLPGLDVTALGRVAENLRKTIAAHLTCPAGAVTSSLGAVMLYADEDWASWLARADAALYRAKQDGRNQVVVG